MTTKTFLVIGGTGKTGRRVVSQLRARGESVRAASRHGEQRFDWSDESTWDAALDGVHGVYVTPLDGSTAAPRFFERAATAGVERVVLLSARGVDVPGYYGDGDVESMLANETALRASGPQWTILRPGWFAQNFSEGIFRAGILAGELRQAAGEGAASFVDTGDIAAVGVAAVTEDGHAGEVYELSGPRAVTFEEATAEIGAATGKPVKYVALPPAEFVEELAGQGWSEADAGMWTAGLSPIARGLEAKISDGVRRALGRDATDFSVFVKNAEAENAWG
ncbi:NAD(P)-dependent oxidoreductase [Saccharothrix sp. ALI-22-I]|uniref:NAD(P)H-binding protein n=1 Tax=Saccharothrix sp. ALI-22-I TaxID=1933778 RepID=UPI00097BDD8E|nr:NAD(P)H-binding protein [Saccharothrix sp. ALI-22-I]ONI92542.1 NAD(P)-dependent oxidoreductase [Saccharothrix sp. ALI-22-I]